MNPLNRRNFLKDTCKACLVGAVSISMIDFLESCSTVKTYKAAMNGNQVEVPLNLFDTAPLQVVSPKNYAYEIAVRKLPDNTYDALLLRCTHQHNPLTPTGNGYLCSVHGSQFDKDGNVKKGPASTHLLQLKTEVNQSNLIIHV
ncbi:QcrA and Rieske domain-containing protein [Chitinophaga arvensicola]|uniref:Rieske [2Fe-2S] domain-containing protein n=1 Tax=Chitinophaga arvensicola TaxID=29529 RepID=A0A1I0R3V1_9BACT|nr:Rieske 2Fe-2S domain-containing protein [Chitinophaga arvensicola]SEW34634.1 Rieske [2Fe-2S] domain-containing protein [Chitinophaga arvensicola]